MMNYNKSVYKHLKTIIIMITMIVSSLILTSCALQSSFVFPAISYTDRNSITSDKSDVSEEINIGSGTLKIALPMSFECLRYLSLMYIGESSGLFKDIKPESNGLIVSLDTLDSYNLGLNVELQSTADTGISDNELLDSYLSDTVPDIMLINNNSQLIMNHISTAWIESSYTDRYFSNSSIYPAMIQNGINNNSLHALPYYASIKMLYANGGVLVDSQKNPLLPSGKELNYNTFKSLSKHITKSSAGIFGYMGLSDLLAFLPSAIDSAADNYMWNGFKFDYTNNAFTRSVSAIKSLISSGYTEDSMNTSLKINLYGSSDPRGVNKIGFWIDDSNKLEVWNSLNKTKLKRYPIQWENQVTLPLSVYSIVINSNSKLLEDAKRFAAYLAFDKDALLFRSRYSNPNGFIPPVKDKAVWDNLVKTQFQGEDLYNIYDKMSFAKSVTNNDEDIVEETYKKLYDEYFNDILYSRKSLTALLPKIDEEANRSIAGK